jgi:hypothetical protein
MNRKILLVGSIIVVVILISVSFTSVVGFQNKTISSSKISPLFSIRTNKVMDLGKNDLNCNYIGKGKKSVLSIPTKKDTMLLSIDKIRKMNNDMFERFVILVIKHIRNNKNVKNEDIDEIIKSLYQLREKPEILYYANNDLSEDSFGIFCVLFWIIYLIFIIFSLITKITIKTECVHTQCTDMCGPTCPPQITCEPEYCFL